MSIRLLITPGRPAETFDTAEALALRLLELARHPTTKAARDIVCRHGVLSTLDAAGGDGLVCVIVKLAQDKTTLGYVVLGDPPEPVEDQYEKVMAALVAAARPPVVHYGPRAA